MALPAVSTSKWQPTAESARRVAHRNSRSAFNTAGRKPKAAAPDGVISRDEFLSGCVLSKQHPLAHLPGSYSLRAEAIAITPPLTRPAPPPGLKLPDSEALSNEAAAESETAPMPETANNESVVDSPAPMVEDYKVLLQNMPDAMLKSSMLRAMLEQGNLKDVTNLLFRASGKVLITFASYASVHKCVNHFHGRKWGSAEPVSASYVFVAPPTEERQAAEASKAPFVAAVKAKSFNTNAPVFVPSFNTNAPVFVPSSQKLDSCHLFVRQLSRTSTDAGPASEGASEGYDSDTGVQATCA